MPALGGPASTVCHSSSVNAAFPVIEGRTLHAARSRLRGASGSRLCGEMVCPSCGTENLEGKKFCKECGTALATATNCGSCGAALAGDEKFCDECGATVAAENRPRAQVTSAREAPASERRLVTVLFADLVGFTALSESRDAEEVRELLSRYFDLCRRLIELYGGTVEKFIGDAVMAVWGTPVATEDDAERAVRAALDLVAAVSSLGQEVGAQELRRTRGRAHRRGGGDDRRRGRGDGRRRSRQHRLAASSRSRNRGSVYVGESTRRATEQAVVYEEAGSFELKGKEGLTPLWKADARRLRRARHAQVARPRGAVRRPRPRAAADQGRCSTTVRTSGRRNSCR